MIKEIRKPELLKYGRFFLSTEAEDEETPQPKSNTKVINVKPNNRRKIDFTDGAEEPEQSEEPSEETPDETSEEDDGPDTSLGDDFDVDSENPDNTTGEENSTPQEQTATDPTVQSPDEEQPSGNDEIDTGENLPDTSTDDTDFTDDVDGDSTGDGEENDSNAVEGDTPDTGEDMDFTDDVGGEDGADVGGEETPADAEADPNADKKGPGLEYDSTRKYNLFENYISLTNAINNYISKLEKCMSDDFKQNQVLRLATEKLREIYDLCYDYMTLRFEISTYVQSLLFFQELIIMIQSVFDLIEKSRNIIKNKYDIIKH